MVAGIVDNEQEGRWAQNGDMTVRRRYVMLDAYPYMVGSDSLCLWTVSDHFNLLDEGFHWILY